MLFNIPTNIIMKKPKLFATLALIFCCCMTVAAGNDVKIKGVYNNNRYDDHADHFYSTYVGWNSTLGKAIFIVENGIYAMNWDGSVLSTPVKEPAVNKDDFYSNGQFTDDNKALWANNFNMMYGNSGAVNANGTIYTIMSRDADSAGDDERFAVRSWDATTGDLLTNKTYPASANLESAGMAVNPVDGKVYGLFYLTNQDLPSSITDDPDFFEDSEGDATSTDAGYCICSIDLATMTVTPITPGLYYYNFVTFAINSEGRAFALTSGGAAGVENEDGKMEDINGNLTGATLYEFDLTTGLMVTVPETYIDEETGEEYTENVTPYPATGYCSQYKRQSACFDSKNPNIMYWNGFYNSGKGFIDGSWSNLPDRDWRTNGKYDTALYAIDITSGEATRLTKIDNRFTFSCMWIENEEEEIPGDINLDGKWDGIDLNILINILLGKDDADNYDGRANIVKDDTIDGNDLNALINILLGKQ